MIDLILFSGELYIQYIVFYLYFYLAGRALVILLSRFSSKSYFIPDTILEIKSNILYPILGLIFVGNILVLLNYFIPLGSLAVKVILIIILMPNLLHVKNKSHITKSKFIIKKELKYLNKLISSIDGFECIPSSTNFILIKTKYNSTYLQKKLLKNKILIRDCKNFRGLNEHYFRIAVKSHRDNVKLVSALESIK